MGREVRMVPPNWEHPKNAYGNYIGKSAPRKPKKNATWFQVYETVSEGTPVTPPFATKDELVDYLSTRGDFWDQDRGDGPWKRERAEAFVRSGFAPSLVVTRSAAGVDVRAPRDGQFETGK